METTVRVNLKSVANKAIFAEVKTLSGAIKLFNQYKNLDAVKKYIANDCKSVKITEKLLTPQFVVENWKSKNDEGQATKKVKGEIVLKSTWTVNDILTVIKNYSNN